MRNVLANPSTISLIVPCLNEELNVPLLVERLLAMRVDQKRWEVILVDDGSTDSTVAVAERLIAEHGPWLRLVRHPKNLGLGAAMRTGFLHSHGSIVCSMDSDCTFAPESLPSLIALVEQGADVATGSPWHPQSEEGTVNPFRKVLSQGCSVLYRLILRSELHSYTSLFRAYRREVLEEVDVRSNGFVAVAETLVYALRAGYKVEELPVRLDKRIHGVSKIGIWASIKSHVRFLSRVGWAAWQPQQQH